MRPRSYNTQHVLERIGQQQYTKSLATKLKWRNHGFFLAWAKHLRSSSNSLAHAPLLTSLPRATQHFPYAVAAGRHWPKVVASVRPATFFTPEVPPPLTPVIVGISQPAFLRSFSCPQLFAALYLSSSEANAAEKALKVQLAPKRESRGRRAFLARGLSFQSLSQRPSDPGPVDASCIPLLLDPWMPAPAEEGDRAVLRLNTIWRAKIYAVLAIACSCWHRLRQGEGSKVASTSARRG